MRESPNQSRLLINLHGLILWSLAAVALLATSPVASAATIGGVASSVVGSSPFNVDGCQSIKSVPLDTVQDSFSLGSSIACRGESASVNLRGNAATASIGLQALANSGADRGAQANALVGLSDRWTFVLPGSVKTGTILTIPVSFILHGTVGSGSSPAGSPFPFLDYVYSIIDPQQGFSQFQETGSIKSPGVFAETFSGPIKLINRGPGLGMIADVEMSLSVPGLTTGSVDFLNTAEISLLLPDGVSVRTSSGVPIDFDTASKIPEPGTWALLAGPLGWLISRMIRRREGSA